MQCEVLFSGSVKKVLRSMKFKKDLKDFSDYLSQQTRENKSLKVEALQLENLELY